MGLETHFMWFKTSKFTMKTSNERNELEENGMRNYPVLMVINFMAHSFWNLPLDFECPKSSKTKWYGKWSIFYYLLRNITHFPIVLTFYWKFTIVLD